MAASVPDAGGAAEAPAADEDVRSSLDDLPAIAWQAVLTSVSSADAASLRLVSSAVCSCATAALPCITLRLSPLDAAAAGAWLDDAAAGGGVPGGDDSAAALRQQSWQLQRAMRQQSRQLQRAMQLLAGQLSADEAVEAAEFDAAEHHMAAWTAATRRLAHVPCVRLVVGGTVHAQAWAVAARELAKRGNVRALHICDPDSSSAADSGDDSASGAAGSDDDSISSSGSAMFGDSSSMFGAGSSMFGAGSSMFGAGSSMFGGSSGMFGAGSTMFGAGSSMFGAGSSMFGGGSSMFGGGSSAPPICIVLPGSGAHLQPLVAAGLQELCTRGVKVGVDDGGGFAAAMLQMLLPPAAAAAAAQPPLATRPLPALRPTQLHTLVLRSSELRSPVPLPSFFAAQARGGGGAPPSLRQALLLLPTAAPQLAHLELALPGEDLNDILNALGSQALHGVLDEAAAARAQALVDARADDPRWHALTRHVGVASALAAAAPRLTQLRRLAVSGLPCGLPPHHAAASVLAQAVMDEWDAAAAADGVPAGVLHSTHALGSHLMRGMQQQRQPQHGRPASSAAQRPTCEVQLSADDGSCWVWRCDATRAAAAAAAGQGSAAQASQLLLPSSICLGEARPMLTVPFEAAAPTAAAVLARAPAATRAADYTGNSSSGAAADGSRAAVHDALRCALARRSRHVGPSLLLPRVVQLSLIMHPQHLPGLAAALPALPALRRLRLTVLVPLTAPMSLQALVSAAASASRLRSLDLLPGLKPLQVTRAALEPLLAAAGGPGDTLTALKLRGTLRGSDDSSSISDDSSSSSWLGVVARMPQLRVLRVHNMPSIPQLRLPLDDLPQHVQELAATGIHFTTSAGTTSSSSSSRRLHTLRLTSCCVDDLRPLASDQLRVLVASATTWRGLLLFGGLDGNGFDAEAAAAAWPHLQQLDLTCRPQRPGPGAAAEGWPLVQVLQSTRDPWRKHAALLQPLCAFRALRELHVRSLPLLIWSDFAGLLADAPQLRRLSLSAQAAVVAVTAAADGAARKWPAAVAAPTPEVAAALAAADAANAAKAALMLPAVTAAAASLRCIHMRLPAQLPPVLAAQAYAGAYDGSSSGVGAWRQAAALAAGGTSAVMLVGAQGAEAVGHCLRASLPRCSVVVADDVVVMD